MSSNFSQTRTSKSVPIRTTRKGWFLRQSAGSKIRRAVCYSDIASKIKSPKASRAVGAAVGKNPISFVVPCHRALGKGGALTGYHWGITRKQAMLGWEAGMAAVA